MRYASVALPCRVADSVDMSRYADAGFNGMRDRLQLRPRYLPYPCHRRHPVERINLDAERLDMVEAFDPRLNVFVTRIIDRSVHEHRLNHNVRQSGDAA